MLGGPGWGARGDGRGRGELEVDRGQIDGVEGARREELRADAAEGGANAPRADHDALGVAGLLSGQVEEVVGVGGRELSGGGAEGDEVVVGAELIAILREGVDEIEAEASRGQVEGHRRGV